MKQYTGDQKVDTLINNYCANKDKHSAAEVNWETVFIKIWERVNNPDKFQSLWANGVRPEPEEMKARLKQEILESEGMCFTGRLSRVVNSLMGFYSDINIQIGSIDQINARINQVLAKYGDSDIETQKEKIRESLREIDVSDSKIEEWIGNIWVPEE
jgi:hypothetical protein